MFIARTIFGHHLTDAIVLLHWFVHNLILALKPGALPVSRSDCTTIVQPRWLLLTVHYLYHLVHGCILCVLWIQFLTCKRNVFCALQPVWALKLKDRSTLFSNESSRRWNMNYESEMKRPGKMLWRLCCSLQMFLPWPYRRYMCNSEVKSFTVQCLSRGMITCLLPFPLETVQADGSDWPAGSDPLRGSHTERADRNTSGQRSFIWVKSFMNGLSS